MKPETKALRRLKGITVENMQSSKGNDVPNQFVIYTPEGVIFQSYSSVIAMRIGNLVILDENKWDWSVTTGKYRNMFLREGIAETRRKIEAGIYKLKELN